MFTQASPIGWHRFTLTPPRLDLRDRMNPDGDIPMHPGRGDRGVGLEFVTKELGSKVGMFGGAMPRQVESIPARPS